MATVLGTMPSISRAVNNKLNCEFVRFVRSVQRN